MKTLIFEGAGWSETRRNDVDNCRIRTRIKNNEGRLIYLEMGGVEVTKYSITRQKPFRVAAHVDHLFYLDRDEDKKKNYSKELAPLTDVVFEYTKENILKFVNENLNCDFEDVVVDNDMPKTIHDNKRFVSSCYTRRA